MMRELSDLYEVVDHTWPAHHKISCGPWALREGRGRGKRMSAANLRSEIDMPDVSVAEKGMFELGQNRLFVIRDGDKKLDQILGEGAYKTIDAVNIYCTSCKELSHSTLPRLSAFDIW